jgi:hypothetical protein
MFFLFARQKWQRKKTPIRIASIHFASTVGGVSAAEPAKTGRFKRPCSRDLEILTS